ncbi:glycosyltransferase [Oceanobacillus sp. FSL W7-1304]|uniref:glycosyltransferase n=1 Tax=Oceanobacillus sp. FSL W7-1304 TaxID=2975322 RepID=UPI0030D819C9
MHNSLISIIIPVYNVEEYLQECLDSVLHQTYKNIEIIAINDGSSDNSLEILKTYALKNENIKIISQENSGQSVARNKGIKIATGKYIYFLDSDDYILPETFEHLIGTMEENNLDLIRFVAEPFADGLDIKLDKKQYNFNNFINPNKIYNKEEFLKLNLLTYSASPVLYIVKKDVLTKKNILFKPGIVHEDDLFNVEVFLNSTVTMYDPTSYYKRRYRPNSTMTTKSIEGRKKSFDSRCIILDELNILLEQYTDKHEINLIKQRIRALTASLIYKYDDIDKSYKRKKIKDLKNLSSYIYYYYIFRRRIGVIVRTVLKK